MAERQAVYRLRCEVHEYYDFFPPSKFISSIWKTRSTWTMTVADPRVISYRRSGLFWSGARSLLMRFTAGILCTLLSPSWKRQRVTSSSCFRRKLTSEKKITYVINNFNKVSICSPKNYFQYIFKDRKLHVKKFLHIIF